MKDIKEFESQIVELEKQFTDAKAYNDIEMSEPVEMVESPNEENEGTPQDNFADFVSYLKSAFTQSVVWHHQTNVYSMHKALNSFYDGIIVEESWAFVNR